MLDLAGCERFLGELAGRKLRSLGRGVAACEPSVTVAGCSATSRRSTWSGRSTPRPCRSSDGSPRSDATTSWSSAIGGWSASRPTGPARPSGRWGATSRPCPIRAPDAEKVRIALKARSARGRVPELTAGRRFSRDSDSSPIRDLPMIGQGRGSARAMTSERQIPSLPRSRGRGGWSGGVAAPVPRRISPRTGRTGGDLYTMHLHRSLRFLWLLPIFLAGCSSTMAARGSAGPPNRSRSPWWASGPCPPRPGNPAARWSPRRRSPNPA